MSLTSRRVARGLFVATSAVGLAVSFFARMSEADADQICPGGQIIRSGKSIVGCLYSTWGPAEQAACNGAVHVPPESPEGCHICVVAPLDAAVLDRTQWPMFTPSDFSCRLAEGPGCEPYSRAFEAGVDDDFDPGGGPELPAPSDALLNYIAQNYSYPGSRDFDQIGGDRWFAHTFTGFAPERAGEYICGARLVTRIGHGETDLNVNDGLALWFLAPNGQAVGSGYWADLASFGIQNGSSQLVTLDLAHLPNGGNLLPDLIANGWLDFTVQDDHAVDFARLEIDYCCEDDLVVTDTCFEGDGALICSQSPSELPVSPGESQADGVVF